MTASRHRMQAIVSTAVLLLGTIWAGNAEAQHCRRSCKEGEKRDPHGCCIAATKAKKPKPTGTGTGTEAEKPAADEPKERTAPTGKLDVIKTTTHGKEAAEPAVTKSSAAPKSPAAIRSVKQKKLGNDKGTTNKRRSSARRVNANTAKERTLTREVKPGVKQRTERPRMRFGDSTQLITMPKPIPLLTWGADVQRSSRQVGRLPWALVGLGVSLLAGGGALQWSASDQFESFDRVFSGTCPAGCDLDESEALEQDRLQAEKTWKLAITSYVVGGALVVAGGTIFVLRRQRRPKPNEESPVSVTPLVSSDAIGASLDIDF